MAGLPNIAASAEGRDEIIVQKCFAVLQTTPPAIVLKHEGQKDELVQDECYKLRQTAAQIIHAHLLAHNTSVAERFQR